MKYICIPMFAAMLFLVSISVSGHAMAQNGSSACNSLLDGNGDKSFSAGNNVTEAPTPPEPEVGNVFVDAPPSSKPKKYKCQAWCRTGCGDVLLTRSGYGWAPTIQQIRSYCSRFDPGLIVKFPDPACRGDGY